MSPQDHQIDPVDPVDVDDLDLKQSYSNGDDLASEAVDPQQAVPGVWDTFLGRNRQKLAKDPIVWKEGSGRLFKSLGDRAKTIFTRRFLACLIAGQLLSVAITSTRCAWVFLVLIHSSFR